MVATPALLFRNNPLKKPGFDSYEEYHPYGTTAWQAPSLTTVSLKRYKYTGMERDEETGLQRHGVRYYATWLGRWTSADPIGLGDGVNRYGYCRGNPTGWIDASGTGAFLAFLGCDGPAEQVATGSVDAMDAGAGSPVSVTESGFWSGENWVSGPAETISRDDLQRRADALVAKIARGDTSFGIDAFSEDQGGNRAPESFREDVLAALKVIAATPSGYSLLSQLAASGMAPKIGYQRGVEESHYKPRGISEDAAGNRTLTFASGAQNVNFDPRGGQLYDSVHAAWNFLPGDVALYHELVHAFQDIAGTYSKAAQKEVPTRYTSVDGRERIEMVSRIELEATGAAKPDFQRLPFTENRYRHERDIVLRPQYSDSRKATLLPPTAR